MEPKKLDIGYSSTAEPSVELVKRAGTFGLTGVARATMRSKGKEIMLAGKLYDAAGGSRLLSREYFGNEETLRRAVHSFADDIVTQYTGEKGIARTRIAYVSDKTGHKELHVMDYDGHNPRKITADRSLCMSPAWSPDKLLAYVSYRDKNPDLYGLDLDTGRRWKISGTGGSTSRLPGLRTGSASGCGPEQGRQRGSVYDGEGRQGPGAPHLRGLRQRVALVVAQRQGDRLHLGQGGSPQLYIMDADGADVRRITFEGAYNASPQWSPRGDRDRVCLPGGWPVQNLRHQPRQLRISPAHERPGERREPVVVFERKADRVQLEPGRKMEHLYHEPRRHRH